MTGVQAAGTGTEIRLGSTDNQNMGQQFAFPNIELANKQVLIDKIKKILNTVRLGDSKIQKLISKEIDKLDLSKIDQEKLDAINNAFYKYMTALNKYNPSNPGALDVNEVNNAARILQSTLSQINNNPNYHPNGTVKEEVHYEMTFDALKQDLANITPKLTDKQLQALENFLTEKHYLKNGKIIVQDIKDLYSAINEFLANPVNVNRVATFSGDGADARISELTGANIVEPITPEGDPSGEPVSYRVLNQDEFDRQDGMPNATATTTPTELTLSAKQVTVTTTIPNEPKFPDASWQDKASIEQYKRDITPAYEAWVNDPKNAQAVTLLLADEFQSEIKKEEDKIYKECGGTYLNVFNSYMNIGSDGLSKVDANDNSARANEQRYYNAWIQNLNRMVEDKKMTPEELDAVLLEAWNKDADSTGNRPRLTSLTDRQKQQAKTLYFMQKTGFDGQKCLNYMAMSKVFDSKSPADIDRAKQGLIKQQVDRNTDMHVTEQRVQNTVVCFDDADMQTQKAISGNKGKKFVKLNGNMVRVIEKCPELFCDEVPQNQSNIGPINGKYYKFSSSKYQDWCAKLCQSPIFNDDVMSVYAENNHMTLNEARSAYLQAFCPELGSNNDIVLETILGNGDLKVSNKELNRLRHIVEDAGYSVDANKTYWQRALHVLGKGALGALLAAGTAGLSSVLSPVAGEVVSPIAQLLVPGQTWSTQDRIVEHNINLSLPDGSTYNYQFGDIVPGESGTTSDRTFTTGGDRLKYKGNNTGAVMGKSGVFGFTLGAVDGLFSMGSINDSGTVNDVVINPYTQSSTSTTVNNNQKGEIVVTTREFTSQVGDAQPGSHFYKYDPKEGAEVPWRTIKAAYNLPDDVDKNAVLEQIYKANGITGSGNTAYMQLWNSYIPDTNDPNKKRPGFFYPIKITIGNNTYTYREEHPLSTARGTGRVNKYNATAVSSSSVVNVKEVGYGRRP